MTTIYVEVAPEFEPVRAAFKENFTRHGDLGAAVCVYRNGRPVVDLWGGVTDAETGRPWTRDTLQLVYSAYRMLYGSVVLSDFNRASRFVSPATRPSTGRSRSIGLQGVEMGGLERCGPAADREPYLPKLSLFHGISPRFLRWLMSNCSGARARSPPPRRDRRRSCHSA